MLPLFFFFKDTPPTEIYTLSLHDALPISGTSTTWPRRPWRCTGRHPASRAGSPSRCCRSPCASPWPAVTWRLPSTCWPSTRSEEHTSELQSRRDLVCRLLLEKKKKDIEQC